MFTILFGKFCFEKNGGPVVLSGVHLPHYFDLCVVFLCVYPSYKNQNGVKVIIDKVIGFSRNGHPFFCAKFALFHATFFLRTFVHHFRKKHYNFAQYSALFRITCNKICAYLRKNQNCAKCLRSVPQKLRKSFANENPS